jgi:hypothetical protein
LKDYLHEGLLERRPVAVLLAVAYPLAASL